MPSASGVQLSWPGRSAPARPAPADLQCIEHAPKECDRWTNRLIHCDNLSLLQALTTTPWKQRLSAAGGLRLIYIDPPFAMEAEHYARHRAGEDRRTHAYSDCWESPGAYLQFMLDRLTLMRDLLADDGVLCVHCDWRASAWLRLLLDELFGRECFRNEIIWRRAPNLGRQAASRQLGRVCDSILMYSRTKASAFRGQVPVLAHSLELGRNGRPRGAKWDPQECRWFTTAPRGDYTDASIASLRAQGRVYDPGTGRVYIKYPLRQGDDGRWYKDQPVDTLWTDPAVRPLRHCTRDELEIGYATQKPLGLLCRIIELTTRPGDLVADFFCGSGTTAAAAHALGRPWIACDNGSLAVHTAHKRLRLAGSAHELAAAGGQRDQSPLCVPLKAQVAIRGTSAEVRLEPPHPARALEFLDYWSVQMINSSGLLAHWHSIRSRAGGPTALTSGALPVPAAGKWSLRTWVVDSCGRELKASATQQGAFRLVG
jgi:DNA modification methylase